MAASDIPDAQPVTDSRGNSSARHPLSDEAQLSPPDGVSTNVSSLAIEGGALGRGALGGGLMNLSGATPPSPDAMAKPIVNADGAISDVDVMLRVKTGDESAFAYLVQKYRRPMVGFMYRMCHNPSTAEELAQEVFLRVYRSRTSYEPSAKFTTWLYRIATNLAVNHARDTRHERPENTVRLDEPDQETGTTPDLADESLSAEEQILKRERLAAIRSKVNALPERQRVAVIMHKYQQMDYRQIAGVLKLSESATKSLLFRAYETLREQLKEFVSGK
ncbi:MAG: sigma-70 family RNA polymerase sigma factor [Terriglobales bacterium]